MRRLLIGLIIVIGVSACTHSKPIGITYDADTPEVWVSNYSESIQTWVDGAP